MCLKPKTFRCSDNEYFIRTEYQAQRWRPLTGVKTEETETTEHKEEWLMCLQFDWRLFHDGENDSVDIFTCMKVAWMKWTGYQLLTGCRCWANLHRLLHTFRSMLSRDFLWLWMGYNFDTQKLELFIYSSFYRRCLSNHCVRHVMNL